MVDLRLMINQIKFGRAIFLISLVCVFSCMDEPMNEPAKKGPLSTEQFAGWTYYNHDNIRLFYPPGHPQLDRFDEIVAGYKTALAGMTKTLDTELPSDTITVLFYPDYETGTRMTGQDYQFVDGNKIHFWLPGFYGVTLAQWFLPRWQPGPIRQQFLKHGLITLFDHSGQNYHAATLRFIEEGRFLPLLTLALDESIDSNRERYNSTEAASFCAFVLAWYGPEVMAGMYRYQGDFETFTRGAFDLSVDSLEMLWLGVIRASQPDKAQSD